MRDDWVSLLVHRLLMLLPIILRPLARLLKALSHRWENSLAISCSSNIFHWSLPCLDEVLAHIMPSLLFAVGLAVLHYGWWTSIVHLWLLIWLLIVHCTAVLNVWYILKVVSFNLLGLFLRNKLSLTTLVMSKASLALASSPKLLTSWILAQDV